MFNEAFSNNDLNYLLINSPINIKIACKNCNF